MLENMDPLGNSELSDQELDRLLREEWKSPPAPARLRGRVFPSWWRKFWTISIRIPLPVACCLTILLAVMAWRWQARIAAPAETSLEVPKFQPVLELRPRIIKVQNAE
jgi:hypothetical protein